MRKTLLALLLVALAVPLAAELPAGWIGAETCATCHEEVATAFWAGAHGTAITKSGPAVAEAACESCHGPGESHVNEPATTNIKPLKGTAADASAGCASCHAAQHGGLLLETSAHVRSGVACLECHGAGHAAPAGEPLLRWTRAQVCAPCHAGQAAQFGLPYAHRNGRTPFECMACHSVHGGTTVRGRIEEAGRPACVRCHDEKAGPWVYPHAINEIDGCVACHRPHGSPNPKLLTRPEPSQLCLECHANTPSFHNLAQTKYRRCVNCHAAVHGSQRDPALFKE